MSKRILITFGGAAYDAQIYKTAMWCQQHGTADYKVYDDRWLIETEFYRRNHWIFHRQPQHGFGFCSWKPYIIRHALRHFADPGDVVMYLDADTYPVADFSCLFDMAHSSTDGILLFEEQGCVNRTWIKGECVRAMVAPTVFEECMGAMHACGRFQLFDKQIGYGSVLIDEFLREWGIFSVDKRCQFHEGSANPLDDDPSFIRNSCEQSVLSLLSWQYDIQLHRNPDQSGWPVAEDGMYKRGDNYPQLFFQDGNRGDIRDLSGSRFRNIA